MAACIQAVAEGAAATFPLIAVVVVVTHLAIEEPVLDIDFLMILSNVKTRKEEMTLNIEEPQEMKK